MFCPWRLFSKQKAVSPHTIQNPAYSSKELPNSIEELQVLEYILEDQIRKLHYSVEDAKKNVSKEFAYKPSNRARASLALRVTLSERKLLFERRLKKIQDKIDELRSHSEKL